ncbi:MAG: response regulator [Candidatus Eisenbacteria bacterium]|uniref:Response regulator n=1 Tax=Eiseniibacteriota bacterium TaxID=2212470 RepID=A0A956NHX6_UNCEI|nr:response regulator [Candidatus Eisenbacteria bacterium]
MHRDRTVLIIDDDEDFRESTETLLESEGYHVVLARSAKDGLSKLEECDPDIIVLDIMMESTEAGYGVNYSIKNLPQYGRWEHVPIVMVSSIDQSPDVRFPRAPEVDLIRPDKYLTKPIDADLFLDTLTKLLQHA